MKKIIALLFLAASSSAVFSQSLVSAAHEPVITFVPENAVFSWAATTFDFGKIRQNSPASHEFTFTNTGDIPLVVSSVKASCGCTVADYTKDPIPVGGQGFVKTTYNAANIGKFTKTVTVNANTEDGVVILTVVGEVVAAQQ